MTSALPFHEQRPWLQRFIARWEHLMVDDDEPQRALGVEQLIREATTGDCAALKGLQRKELRQQVKRLLKNRNWSDPDGELAETVQGWVRALDGDFAVRDTVGLALGHASSEGNVSAGYVVDLERLRALRPLYEARERRLRQLAGLEINLDPMAHLTAEQRAVYKAAMGC